jgi:hypothetical protein
MKTSPLVVNALHKKTNTKKQDMTISDMKKRSKKKKEAWIKTGKDRGILFGNQQHTAECAQPAAT